MTIKFAEDRVIIDLSSLGTKFLVVKQNMRLNTIC